MALLQLRTPWREAVDRRTATHRSNSQLGQPGSRSCHSRGV